MPQLAELAIQYRSLETGVVSPRLAPGILDNEPFDQVLFVRGKPQENGRNRTETFSRSVQ